MNNITHNTEPPSLLTSRWVISRRVFLKAAGGALAIGSLSCRSLPRMNSKAVRFGIVTDCHYADADPSGARYYRESFDKLAECVETMNAERVDFLVELGDFKDQNTPPDEQSTICHLVTIETVLQQFNGPIYHVLGNHDTDSISKELFLSHVTNTGIHPQCSYYSFDRAGVRFIVLDANFRADGIPYGYGNFKWTDANIPPAEMDWLKQTLAEAPGHCIIFTHQLLSGTGDTTANNAKEVRETLEASNKVLAVFQGHHHGGGYKLVENIHFYTLKAVVEGSGENNNSYAIVEVTPTGDITVTGYRRATSMRLDVKIPTLK